VVLGHTISTTLCGILVLVFFCEEGSQEIFVYCSKSWSTANIQE